MDLQHRVFWITGASSGIGAALAQAMAQKGAGIILSGRNVAALEETAAQLGGESLILPFETTDYDALPGLAAKAHAWRGRIDGLVNNAGISQRSLAVDTEPAVYHNIIAVDLLAPILLTQAVLPSMVAAGTGQVINISSVAGLIGAPIRTAYSAAKAGIAAYGDALRSEAEQAHGIRVLNVFPGSVKTDVARNALNADGSRRGESDSAIENGMPPAECARQILEAMAAGQRELVVAQGMEAELARLCHADREQMYRMTAAFGATIVAAQSHAAT